MSYSEPVASGRPFRLEVVNGRAPKDIHDFSIRPIW
jgi:hypothetical protein